MLSTFGSFVAVLITKLLGDVVTGILSVSKEILSGFGARVRKAREDAGFDNQKKLAAALGVASGTVGNWESENNTPTLQQTAELARVLRISVDALIGEAHGAHGQSLEQTIREIAREELEKLLPPSSKLNRLARSLAERGVAKVRSDVPERERKPPTDAPSDETE